MKILKEPLLHFVLIGALLFALYQHFVPQAAEPGETEVVVPPGRILQLSSIFQKTWQRPPTHEELQGLVDDFILEEIYYREATIAGLDQDDTLIRRRLRQKMEFITDDLATGEPSDEELLEFVNEHPGRFQTSAETSFRQIYFNPEKLGENPDAAIEAAAAQLAEGKPPEGHATLLPEAMTDATPTQITSTFGDDFANGLGKLPVGEWAGPVRSAFGIHLVRVDERQAGELPPLEKIRPQALREWQHDQRLDFRQNFDRELLEKYKVTVEWPAAESPQG